MTAACVTTASRPETSATPMGMIDGAELRASGAPNVYEAINRLRPAFFTTRGGTSFINEPAVPIVVVVNRLVSGGVEQLRDLDARVVRSVRRITAAEVFMITGRSAPAGGVEVVLGP
ncbi:MAG TPA: hypothetical protein VIP11_02975 [Gemmatimonadaceae bacterium]